MSDGSGFLSFENREPTVAELRLPSVSTSSIYIQASCRCGHQARVDPRTVCVARDTGISRVGQVLRCRQCGTRGLSTVAAVSL